MIFPTFTVISFVIFKFVGVATSYLDPSPLIPILRECWTEVVFLDSRNCSNETPGRLQVFNFPLLIFSSNESRTPAPSLHPQGKGIQYIHQRMKCLALVFLQPCPDWDLESSYNSAMNAQNRYVVFKGKSPSWYRKSFKTQNSFIVAVSEAGDKLKTRAFTE